MGMAASQARYLELTARKSNVEYEGQQVNQQRTELANESAGLFSQLMSMQVPTAPSSNQYTSVNYSFSDGNTTYYFSPSDVSTISGDPNNNVNLVYHSTQSIYTGVCKTLGGMSITGTGQTNDPYYLGLNTKLTQCSSSDVDAASEAKALYQVCVDGSKDKVNGINTLIGDVKYDATKNEAENIALITSNLSKAYTYTASNGTTYYLSATDLNDKKGQTNVSINNYYAANLNTEVYATQKAYLQTSDTNTSRYSKVTLGDTSTSYDVGCTSTTDNNAYNDAMNNYNYQYQVYQQEVNNINARTSIIQQQDRTLELRLRQLDTEQNALSTELDAVKSVIKKNVESTFKTFSS
jgi:hypothetical protein